MTYSRGDKVLVEATVRSRDDRTGDLKLELGDGCLITMPAVYVTDDDREPPAPTFRVGDIATIDVVVLGHGNGMVQVKTTRGKTIAWYYPLDIRPADPAIKVIGADGAVRDFKPSDLAEKPPVAFGQEILVVAKFDEHNRAGSALLPYNVSISGVSAWIRADQVASWSVKK